MSVGMPAGGGLHYYQHTAADGGTAVMCGLVVPSEVRGDTAPAAERGAFGCLRGLDDGVST